MLRKTNSQKGFTIIEVVIAIAIGAAVMALVLNAVAGARRSQRNNARASDVNQVAAGVNQFIATRNDLPSEWTDIQQIIDPSKFGHYDKLGTVANASINPQGSWDNGNPSQANRTKFIPADGFNVNGVAGGTHNNGIGSTTAADAADKMVVFTKAACVGTDKVGPGGIREMAIAYRLEGQDDIICLEI